MKKKKICDISVLTNEWLHLTQSNAQATFKNIWNTEIDSQ
jgi:hypothetical protein